MKYGYAHIVIVLDRSGSMASCAADTVGGFNSFIEDQKKVEGEATLTLAQFDNVYELVHNGAALKDIPSLRFEPRGQTALLDAIGRTINDTGVWLTAKAEDARPEKVIFVIMTDGQENASREFTKDKIFEMIRHQENKYQWQFVFIGANQDAIATGLQMGVSQASSLTYDAARPRQAYATVSKSLMSVRRTGARVSFTDADRLNNRPSGK